MNMITMSLIFVLMAILMLQSVSDALFYIGKKKASKLVESGYILLIFVLLLDFSIYIFHHQRVLFLLDCHNGLRQFLAVIGDVIFTLFLIYVGLRYVFYDFPFDEITGLDIYYVGTTSPGYDKLQSSVLAINWWFIKAHVDMKKINFWIFKALALVLTGFLTYHLFLLS